MTPASLPSCERVPARAGRAGDARTEDVGYVGVDEARLAFADPDALTAWRTDDPVDGLADVAFWGRDEHILVQRTGAGALRVEVGAPEIVERQRKLEDRWSGRS